MDVMKTSKQRYWKIHGSCRSQQNQHMWCIADMSMAKFNSNYEPQSYSSDKSWSLIPIADSALWKVGGGAADPPDLQDRRLWPDEVLNLFSHPVSFIMPRLMGKGALWNWPPSVRLNFKLGSTQTEHEDPYHRQAPWSQRSKVKVAKSRNASERCWPISWKRNVLETPKLIGILPIRPQIMRTSFKVKGQGHQVD